MVAFKQFAARFVKSGARRSALRRQRDAGSASELRLKMRMSYFFASAGVVGKSFVDFLKRSNVLSVCKFKSLVAFLS